MSEVQREWTDQELDEALALLHADVRTGAPGAARARAALMAVVGTDAAPRARRRWHWVAAAAAVVAVLVGGSVVVRSWSPGSDGTAAPAVEVPDPGPGIAAPTDPVVGPGQYLRIATHYWTRGGVGDRSAVDPGLAWQYLVEHRDTTWVPADRDAEWRMAQTTTGVVRWLTGDPVTLPPGHDDPTVPTGDYMEGPGDFSDSSEPPGWNKPTRDFLDGLPRDPARLYDRLAVDDAGQPVPPLAMVRNAARALRTGLMPAAVQAALHRALARVPGIRIVDGAVDPDGRSGIGFAVTDEVGFVSEIVVDPRTGRFLGDRETGPGGVELGANAVTVDVVDRLEGWPIG